MCDADDHLAENCPIAMATRETALEIRTGDANEIVEDAASEVATEVAGGATDPTGEPQGDSPAGDVAEPEADESESPTDLRFAVSQAEGRHYSRPADQDGAEPRDKGKGKSKSKSKGKSKGKGSSSRSSTGKGESLWDLAHIGSQPPPNEV